VQPYLAVDGVVGDLTSQGELCRPAVASRHGRQATGGAVEVEDTLGGHDTHPNLLERAVDLAAEPELELYDMAALVPVVTEAGGRFTSLDGEPGPFGGNAVATNSLLHDVALHHLSAETD